jgi:hypothetical protein
VAVRAARTERELVERLLSVALTANLVVLTGCFMA